MMLNCQTMEPYYQDNSVTIYNGDCAEIVPQLAKFDLLLTDPPYGINENDKKNNSREKKAKPRNYGVFNWDKNPISDKLINLVQSACKKQIIWGGNYYNLGPCKGPLIWDKENTGDFADGELAWNNLGCALRIKKHLWNGMLRKGKEQRYHPTQKPLDIIAWCIVLAGDVQTILDPFAGAGTTGRAAKDMGKTAVLIEKEERYCEIAAKRMAQEVFEFE